MNFIKEFLYFIVKNKYVKVTNIESNKRNTLDLSVNVLMKVQLPSKI